MKYSRFKVFKLIVFLFFIIAQDVKAQNDTTKIYNDPIIREQDFSDTFGENILEIKLTNAQNQLERRETYIYVLLGLLLFVMVAAAFIINAFYSKAKKTVEVCEIQNTELLLRERRIEELSLIINNIYSSIIIADKQGKIEFVNENFKKLTGYTLEKLQENKLDNLLNIHSLENEKSVFDECVNKKLSKRYDSRIKSESGKMLNFKRNLFSVMNKDQEIILLIANDNDYNI